MTSTRPIVLTRDQVLAYCADVHDLSRVSARTGDGPAVLGLGVQDNPPGRSARLALVLRGRPPADRSTVLIHSMRAALHLHRSDDLGRYASALRHEDSGELSTQSFGPFGGQLVADGLSFTGAVDGVADAMGVIMADGVARTKGELSTAVTPLVDPRVAPWCEGCRVHHVHDALFRYGTLQAGLTIEVESPTVFRFIRVAHVDPADTHDSRVGIMRRFLRLSGPVKPAHLASWLGLSPAGGRRWWNLVRDDLTAVTVGRRKGWVHSGDVDDLKSAPEPPDVRLLGPYDPVTELGDRELLVPEPARRRQVWKATSNPGVLLVRGDVAGTWRQRTAGNRLTLMVAPFGQLTAAQRRAAADDAQTIAAHRGATESELLLE